MSGDLSELRLLGVVGRGGMGVVYEALHLSTGRRRAVKLLDAARMNHADAAERMMREARAASALRSKHATRIYSYGVTRERTPYIVMELLEGVDLATFMANAGGPIAIDDAITIVSQACEAVAEAHSYGMVHRDLKPGNIFVTRTASGALHVKLLDFGLAKLAPSEVSTHTCSGLVFGTPQYMPPEQLKSSTDVDARSDVWALGVILCELVYGASPFGGQNVTQLIASILSGAPEVRPRPDAPNELRRIVLKCLEKAPKSRYSDAASLREDLELVARGTMAHDWSGVTPRPWSFDSPTRPAPLSPPDPAPWSRGEWTFAFAVCVTMLAAGVLTSAAMRPLRSPSPASAPQPVEPAPPMVVPPRDLLVDAGPAKPNRNDARTSPY